VGVINKNATAETSSFLDGMIRDHGNFGYFAEQMIGVCVSAVMYEVLVTTGEPWNASTDAVVSLTLYGEMGDTGSRQLLRARNNEKMFRAGQVLLRM